MRLFFILQRHKKIFYLPNFSCAKITTVFSRQLISMRLFFILQRHEIFFYLPNFSCVKHPLLLFSRQLISMRLNNRTKSTLQDGSEHELLHFRSPFNLIEIITSIWSILPGFKNHLLYKTPMSQSSPSTVHNFSEIN